MDEIKLWYFISVARHLSFSRAAEDCNVTQSTISKQISALEKELGTSLFYRDHHHVALTPAGSRLANDAEDYMERYRLINENVRQLHLEHDQFLNIGVGPYDYPLLSEPLARFAEVYPTVSVYTALYTYKRMVSHFRSNTIDVGICTELCTDTVPNLYTQRLGIWKWEVVSKKDSILWDMPKEDQQNLKDQTVITLYENPYEPVRPHCIKNEYRNKNFTYTNQYPTLLSLLSAGMGVALLPEFLRDQLPPALRMSRYRIHPLKVSHVAAYNPGKKNQAAENFLEICREVYASNDTPPPLKWPFSIICSFISKRPANMILAGLCIPLI